MTQDDIAMLLAAMRANGVTRLEWGQARKGTQLCLVLPEGSGAPPAPPPAPLPIAAASPGIGAFAPRGGADGLPPLAPGDAVRAGEILGYIAQGAALQCLAAPAAGVVSGPLPEAGRLFGFGETVADLEGEPE